MVSLRQHLAQYREDTPRWLQHFAVGDQFQPAEFFSSRLVYYPGSGIDGQPIEAFNAAHAAHCFVYVDYGVPRDELERRLQRVTGYRVLCLIDIDEGDLFPNGFTRHPGAQRWRQIERFQFLAILERADEADKVGDEHGAERFAILFIAEDGIATYDALFCRGNASAPFCIVLWDHGFGGNYDRFGAAGLLEQHARAANAWPLLLLVGDTTEAWEGYQLCDDVVPEPRGPRGIQLFQPAAGGPAWQGGQRRSDEDRRQLDENLFQQVVNRISRMDHPAPKYSPDVLSEQPPDDLFVATHSIFTNSGYRRVDTYCWEPDRETRWRSYPHTCGELVLLGWQIDPEVSGTLRLCHPNNSTLELTSFQCGHWRLHLPRPPAT